ncbi:peptide-methionine (S)-S-oxide reductase, partial [Micromonospora sp. ATA32]|nr:peptide-methionine (S)-S-oxide reductase [Micromonospora sp. ATA32]
MEELFRHQPGVVSTRVGYSGGDVPNATYRNHGTHAESIEVVYDTEKTDFRALLEFFFQIHDPSTNNRQGNDIGTSYRSRSSTPATSRSGSPRHDRRRRRLGPVARKVVTEVTRRRLLGAEPEHQNYLQDLPQRLHLPLPPPRV